MVAPGTQVNGTILFAQKAADKYSRPRLVLNFSNIVSRNGTVSPLYADMIDVDNARFAGTAVGYIDIQRPSAPRKASNATGDGIVSDGAMTVVKIGPLKALQPNVAQPALKTRQ